MFFNPVSLAEIIFIITTTRVAVKSVYRLVWTGFSLQRGGFAIVMTNGEGGVSKPGSLHEPVPVWEKGGSGFQLSLLIQAFCSSSYCSTQVYIHHVFPFENDWHHNMIRTEGTAERLDLFECDTPVEPPTFSSHCGSARWKEESFVASVLTSPTIKLAPYQYTSLSWDQSHTGVFIPHKWKPLDYIH